MLERHALAIVGGALVLTQFPRDATNFGRNRRPMFGQRIERIGVSSAGLPPFTKIVTK
jgi:hypothetical protein